MVSKILRQPVGEEEKGEKKRKEEEEEEEEEEVEGDQNQGKLLFVLGFCGEITLTLEFLKFCGEKPQLVKLNMESS